MPSGLSVTTFWLPRTEDRACKNPSFVIWNSLKSSWIFLSPSFKRAKKRCSTETYSSPIAFAWSSAFIITLLASWEKYCCPPETLGRLLIFSSSALLKSSTGTSIFSRSFSIRLSSMSNKLYKIWSCSMAWLPWSRAIFWLLLILSTDFWVKRLMFIGVPPLFFLKIAPLYSHC